MDIKIRQESIDDYSVTENVVEKTFKNAEHTDHKEQFLVANLRKSEAFVPELSLVAEIGKEIIGHAMYTKIIIKNNVQEYHSLALAPVSVLPEYQSKGIGSALIKQGLEKAKELGFKSVIVLGHSEYYPRFGFKPASLWNINAPFEVPDDSFLALELEDSSLANVSGTVVYPKEFFE
ncbi:N-acetyltransferase [Tissierella sp. Yu-01]|uniref:GNAT family N-acetyltransferase n=1 Tax=Tissierella sp. Yu-01 TaxID=3035694 RepID=UPI00240E93B0|nr:N-acetyltransferase [Tissierella sp. Yu-01]WFA09026.1 N-acetyltransferase [Tissierella sp. Yu-01]